MIDDKKIEDAASAYGTNNDCSIIGPDGRMSLKPELETAFETSAHWAINAFLKDLWHQTDKEPEGYDEWILLHYNVGNYFSILLIIQEIGLLMIGENFILKRQRRASYEQRKSY